MVYVIVHYISSHCQIMTIVFLSYLYYIFNFKAFILAILAYSTLR